MPYQIRNPASKDYVSGRLSKTIEERVQGRWTVDEATGCWNWHGVVKEYNPKLRPHVSFGGRVYIATHAVLMALEGVDVPSGMQVNHHCDNHLCVNPEHVYIGTPLQNVLDRYARGKGQYWET